MYEVSLIPCFELTYTISVEIVSNHHRLIIDLDFFGNETDKIGLLFI